MNRSRDPTLSLLAQIIKVPVTIEHASKDPQSVCQRLPGQQFWFGQEPH
jgi:hypothetical protein